MGEAASDALVGAGDAVAVGITAIVAELWALAIAAVVAYLALSRPGTRRGDPATVR